MTTYSTDFSEYVTGSPPSDWTDRWLTATWAQDIATDTSSYGGKKLVTSISATHGMRLFTWDDVDGDANRADSEILLRIKAAGDLPNDSIGLVIRGSGSAGSETGYLLRASYDDFRILTYEAGTLTGSYTFPSPLFPDNEMDQEWYWMRFRLNGSTFNLKLWKDVESEPSAWQGEYTNTSITAAGSVGISIYNASSPDVYWDYFAVGTNGDSPSLPVYATANIRADQQYLQVAEETPLPPIRADQQYLQVAEETPLPPIRADQQYLQVAYEYIPPPTEMETDFSEYATGSPPTGWTERWDTASVTWDIIENTVYDGGKLLTQSVHSADARTLLSWDSLDGAADVELLLRLRTNSAFGSGAEYFTYLQVRASGASGAENGYWAALRYSGSAMELVTGKYIAGTLTVLATYAINTQESWDWESWTFYLLRFSVVGTSLKAKVWPDGTPEPGWQLEVTDSSITAGGWAGIGEYFNNEAVYYDFLSVGLDGTPAALSTNVETSSRLSQALAEVAIVGTAPQVRVTQALAEVAVVKPYPDPPSTASFVVVTINT